jgi:allophanate hydrolase subunit 2
VRLAVHGRFGELTYQDAGRPGWRKFGVPPAGPWCRDLAEIGAALAGHGLESPVLEVGGTLSGVVEEEGQLAWPGGGRLEADGVALAPGLHWLPRGTLLRASAGQGSGRLYLATPGGWEAPQALGSGCGPVEGTLVGSGAPARRAPVLWTRGRPTPDGPLCFVPVGPFAWTGGLRVARSSRMGVRLTGAPPGPVPARASLPAVPGAVQWTPDGELIALGPDGPTVGGYTVVGWLPEPDMWRLGSAPVGAEFDLEAKSAAQAEEAARAAFARLARLVGLARDG